MFLQQSDSCCQVFNFALESLNHALLELLELASDQAFDHRSTRLQCLEQLSRFADLLLQGIFQAAGRINRVKESRHRLHEHLLWVIRMEGC